MTDARAVHDAIHAALADGPRTAYELTAALWSNLPVDQVYLGVSEVLGHVDLLADDGRIKIGDFGLARAATANTATGAALLGTIAYLSPELVTRGVADARSDIYSLGCTLHYLLAGKAPYATGTLAERLRAHMNEPPRRTRLGTPGSPGS